jgi:murein DD-endopeptidase MepM/ murein hydrolase activator NlpD
LSLTLLIPKLKRTNRLAVAVLIPLVSACTVSGAGFLHSNSEGFEPEPYRYPVQTYDNNTITIMEGDTLYSIAINNHIDLRALMDENNLYAPYTLRPGDRLRIPSPGRHEVLRGETLYSIARDYDVDTLGLASLNSIRAPYHIVPGQKLDLPGGSRKIVSTQPKKTGWRLGPFGPFGADEKPAPVGQKSPKRANQSTPLPRGGGRFVWPADGKIISRFGAKSGGQHNDGINIGLAKGAPIYAAADGTVTYVGNELRSYGNLILVRHSGGWTSAYAHNRKVWVEEGQTVKKGQHISNAGQTGDASSPQLHFELRRGSKSVDPEKYLNQDITR